MSTIDPDARGRHIGQSLRFLVWPALILGTLSGPVIGIFEYLTRGANFTGAFLLFIFLSVGLGLLVYYLPTKRSPLATAAYIIAYVAGLATVMASTQSGEDFDAVTFRNSIIILVVLYGVAILLVFLYARRHLGIAYTTEHGVDTTGTVMSAGVDGMVNYVQHQRLTIKFKDQQGVERYLRIGRTGGGYSAGDEVPLRYDPEHPGMKHRIIVG